MSEWREWGFEVFLPFFDLSSSSFFFFFNWKIQNDVVFVKLKAKKKKKKREPVRPKTRPSHRFLPVPVPAESTAWPIQMLARTGLPTGSRSDRFEPSFKTMHFHMTILFDGVQNSNMILYILYIVFINKIKVYEDSFLYENKNIVILRRNFFFFKEQRKFSY